MANRLVHYERSSFHMQRLNSSSYALHVRKHVFFTLPAQALYLFFDEIISVHKGIFPLFKCQLYTCINHALDLYA